MDLLDFLMIACKEMMVTFKKIRDCFFMPGIIQLITGVVVADPAGAATRASWTADDVLYGIRWVESRDGQRKDIYPHPDGSSWGVYGVTHWAVLALDENGVLTFDQAGRAILTIDDFRFVCAEWDNLANPAFNCAAAEAYLMLMKKLHKCKNWIEAAGWYHGGDQNEREEYMEEVEKAIRAAGAERAQHKEPCGA
jgi:hypothetical protein